MDGRVGERVAVPARALAYLARVDDAGGGLEPWNDVDLTGPDSVLALQGAHDLVDPAHVLG